MSNKFFQEKLTTASAKLSLWLVDTLDAMRYGSYINEYLTNSDIAYRKYTLVFGFDYNDDTQKMWKVFLLSNKNQWKSIEIPNPFHTIQPSKNHSSSQEDASEKNTVAQSEGESALLVRNT